MIEAIASLREIADQTEADATGTDCNKLRDAKIDLAVKVHWLAREAAKLCAESKKLNGADTCAQCAEKCF
jgi:hypothetical protein